MTDAIEFGDVYSTTGLVVGFEGDDVLMLNGDFGGLAKFAVRVARVHRSELKPEWIVKGRPDHWYRAFRQICRHVGDGGMGRISTHDRDLLTLAFRLLDKADSVPPAPCAHGDEFCPCNDGDPCHYEGLNPAPCLRTGTFGCDCRRAAA